MNLRLMIIRPKSALEADIEVMYRPDPINPDGPERLTRESVAQPGLFAYGPKVAQPDPPDPLAQYEAAVLAVLRDPDPPCPFDARAATLFSETVCRLVGAPGFSTFIQPPTTGNRSIDVIEATEQWKMVFRRVMRDMVAVDLDFRLIALIQFSDPAANLGGLMVADRLRQLGIVLPPDRKLNPNETPADFLLLALAWRAFWRAEFPTVDIELAARVAALVGLR